MSSAAAIPMILLSFTVSFIRFHISESGEIPTFFAIVDFLSGILSTMYLSGYIRLSSDVNLFEFFLDVSFSMSRIKYKKHPYYVDVLFALIA